MTWTDKQTPPNNPPFHCVVSSATKKSDKMRQAKIGLRLLSPRICASTKPKKDTPDDDKEEGHPCATLN